MTDKAKVLKALQKIPTYAELEREADIPAGIIGKAVRGDRSLTNEQVEKLLPVLKNRKLIK